MKNDLSSLLGNKTYIDGVATFIPIIPFTKGETYEIRTDDGLWGSFIIDTNEKNRIPELVTIYPTLDTVPQNLLKMYFVFSEPMQHTKSALNFIHVYDESDKKETEIFLELESELWNKEHTILTLWLDPGRIKTDLIPNKEKGPPLLQNHTYTITIDSLWASAKGKPLLKKYVKRIIAIDKDINKPAPNKWNLTLPNKNTLSPLYINFNEPMDAILAMETLQIENIYGKSMNGVFSHSHNERKLVFKPEKKWKEGSYTLHINPALEDLAGNNLDRLFDTDLSKNQTIKKETSHSLQFSIK